MAASVWRGRLAFGLVSIPVRLFKAARRERIRFHHVYRPAVNVPEDAEPAPEPEVEPAKPSGRLREAPEPEPVMEAPLERVRNRPVGEFSEAPVQQNQLLKALGL